MNFGPEGGRGDSGARHPTIIVPAAEGGDGPPGAAGASPPAARIPRSSAVRRADSASPLGFARASPSPPSHAEPGATLARKLSLGGGRPYTPFPQGELEHSL